MTQDVQSPVRRGRLDAERFRRPGRTDRPGFRWWWQSPVPPTELVRELRAIAAAGFGEVEIAFSPGFWGDEAQRAALAVVLDEAERLDVGVAATVGAAWPLQTPNTTRGTEHAAQELQYGVTYVAKAERGPVEVPRPIDDPRNARGARLHAVAAAHVVRPGGAPTFTTVRDWHGERVAIGNPERSTLLDPDTLIDLTDRAFEGVVTLPEADGEWALFGFWMRDCAQGVTSFLDRDAAVAATRYLDEYQFGAANLERFGRVGTDWFEDSLELNADSLFWTDDLLDRFRRRHGYDLAPYLPVLFVHGMCRYWVPNDEPVPDFALGDGSDARVRRDYYRLMTDLYIADHLLVLQAWCARYGLRHKAQVAYGQNLEPVRSNRAFVRHGGRAEGESLNSGDRAPVDRGHPNWRFALDWQRCVVGGAHQGGALRISTELGAQFGAAFGQSLGDLQQMLDKEWAAGITKPFVHGFASQEAGAPWPTQSRFFDLVSESWNDTRFPEWAHWPALTDYWARGTVVLETGTPQTDVAIHRDGFLTTAARGTPEQDATAPAMFADTETLERRGYTVQYVDPIGLAEAGTIGADGTLFPDGPAYRGLVVDERSLTPQAAEAIDRAAARGLRVVVVGEPPSADSGFAHGAEGGARVQAAMHRLLARDSVAQVATTAATASAFRTLGLRPRAEGNGPLLLTQWRAAGERNYVLVYNTGPDTESADLSFEGAGSVSELDLWTGDIRPLPYTAADGRTVCRLDLTPLGVRVVELDRSAGAGTRAPDPAPHQQELEVGPWHLEVTTAEAGDPRTIVLDGQGPADWRGVDALSAVSGTGVYRTTVVTGGHDHFILDIGQLAGSATVRSGGRRLGTVYTSGRTLDLGDALASDPILEIEVRTILNNAVRTAGPRPNIPDLPVHRPARALLPQGLVGPVRVYGSRSAAR